MGHTINRVPYLLVVGDKEKETGSVAVRTRKGDDLGTLSLEDFISILEESIAQRGRFQMEK